MMRKLYEKIVSHPKIVLTIFLILSLISVFAKNMVIVNYDMRDYLPADTHSTRSLQCLRAEFKEEIPNARVMIKDVSIPQALAYKEQIAGVRGVLDVLWLDDAADINLPLAMLDQKTVESYYKDNTALFTVTIREDLRIEAVAELREIIGEDNAMSGDAVSGAIATVSTVSEIRKIAIASVIFAFFVLFVTTYSWLEPPLVMLGLGVAILINAGSNAIFGEISFVTNAAGSILQLAVSLDYSVFLLHRFEECLKTIPEPKEAMIEALCRSTVSILSSGMTTVIGFLALVFMRFGIGPDLGLALAKGVGISLITVFTFMPIVILASHKLLHRLRHRPFLPSFGGLGKAVCRIMTPAVIILLLVVAPAYLASNANSFYYGASHIFGEGTQAGDDAAAIEEVFGRSDTYVMLVPRGAPAAEKELSAELKTMPEVKSIVSYVDSVGAEIPPSYLDKDTLSKLESDRYSRLIINVEAAYEGEKTFALVEKVRAVGEKYYPGQYYLAGEGISTYDLMDTITEDMIKVNLIAVGAIFVVLLIAMRSLVLPVILVLNIEIAIWLNLAIPYFADTVVFYISYLIISSIQLGATVDYAILFTGRYLEYRLVLPKKEAVQQTVQAVFVSIMTSGSTVAVAGFVMGAVSSHGIISQLGTFLGRGSLLSMAVVFSALPGMLYWGDKLITRTTLKYKPYQGKTEEAGVQ